MSIHGLRAIHGPWVSIVPRNRYVGSVAVRSSWASAASTIFCAEDDVVVDAGLAHHVAELVEPARVAAVLVDVAVAGHRGRDVAGVASCCASTSNLRVDPPRAADAGEPHVVDRRIERRSTCSSGWSATRCPARSTGETPRSTCASSSKFGVWARAPGVNIGDLVGAQRVHHPQDHVARRRARAAAAPARDRAA